MSESGSGDHDTRAMTVEEAVALLQESWEDNYLSVEEKQAIDALAARVAALEHAAGAAKEAEVALRLGSTGSSGLPPYALLYWANHLRDALAGLDGQERRG